MTFTGPPAALDEAHYTESVPANRWILVLLFLSSAAAGLGAVVAATSEDGSAGWVGFGVLAGVSILLLLVGYWFASLRIRVDADGIEARYGPFRHRTRPAEVTSVEVERYPWRVYAGWGIRYRTGGRRAWSVPFIPAGVAIATADGKRYHLSSREPERLRSAIMELLD